VRTDFFISLETDNGRVRFELVIGKVSEDGKAARIGFGCFISYTRG
jgi:hypothetical protein